MRNRTFSARKTAPMLKYLNEMSKNGLHINKIGKLSCSFTEDASIRYVYSICSEHDEALYTEKSGWEHFCNYKGVPFYRKAVPADAVKLTRSFKKKQLHQEERWLNTRLGEGLALIAKIENEYIFERTDEKKDFEYSIRYKQKQKKKGDTETDSPLGDISGYVFVCVTEDGAYYLIKDEAAKHSVDEKRGKRLSNLLFCATVVTAATLGFCAFLLISLFGFIKGGNLKIPMLIIGGVGALICAIIFAVYLSKFKKITEARRIMREEKRRARQQSAQTDTQSQPKPIEEPASNTVVMNTVVMNNYGSNTPQQAPFNPEITQNGQMIDSNTNPALDPKVNPAIASGFVGSVLNGVRYGDAADTINQGEHDGADIWQPDTFGVAAAKPIHNDEDWVSIDGLVEEDDEPKTDGDENEELDSFPLSTFIGFALICFVSVLAAILGIRYCITWFASLGQGSALTLALSVIGIGFSPFTFRFGLTGCKEMFEESDDDTFEE